MQARSKSSLSPARVQLVERMQRLGFGVIEGLRVRNGEPVLDPPPRVIREVKLGAENGPRHEAGLEDFTLKSEVRELLDELDSLENGTILRLQVKHGLPFRVEVEGFSA